MQLHRIVFPVAGSTNNTAKELIRSQAIEHGTIIQALDQSAGRGYGTNTWESEPGKNITATWVLKPGFLHPSRQFAITMVLSLAVYETVVFFTGEHSPVSIKWPNDVYYKDQKIAGILVENTILGETIRECFAGIGLNVNQLHFLSDAPNPVSLAQICQKEISTDHCLEVLNQNILSGYELLQKNQTQLLEQSYHQKLYRLNTWSTYESQGKIFRGKIETTDTYGRLVIRREDQSLHMFDFKEVRFVL